MTGRTRWLAEGGLYLGAMAVVTAMGCANLFLPFGPDQAMFYYGAERIDLGAIYYADYWDNKQPGIYWFYLLAGKLFGFSESRIHLLELIWMLAFAAALMAGLRGAFRRRWLSAVVPIATVGVYYGVSGPNELTQLEFIVAFPLFAFVLCLVWAQRKPNLVPVLYFASGLLAGVAVVFKLLLAALCVALWLVALIYLWRGHRLSVTATLTRAVAPAAAGVVLVLGAVVLLFLHWGSLDALLWTAFVYPPRALATAPLASVTRLATAGGFFISGVAPWALFALVAAGAWLRRDRDLLGALMLTWFVAGTGLFLVQRFSWWYYHTLLVLLPVGVLAVMGIDRLCTWLDADGRFGARRATLVAAVFAFTASTGLADDFIRKARPMLSEILVQKNGVRFYQTEVSRDYRRLLASVRFLQSPDARPGPIYAFGDAMIHVFSGRPSPHHTLGWTWRWLVPEQIDGILQALDHNQVPYVFIEATRSDMSRQHPKVTAYLESHYFRHHRDESGIWYERRAETE
jgi:hypothetical protein